MFQGDTSLIMQEKGGITKRRNSSRCEKEQNQNLSERISYKRKDPSSTHSREDEHKYKEL